MINPSFLYTGLKEISCAPFSLYCHISPPFLAGYSNYHCMKERWHKSNPSTIAIALGTQLLLNIVSPTGNNEDNTDETSTSRQHPSFAGARVFHIVSHHIDKQQSTGSNDDNATMIPCAQAYALDLPLPVSAKAPISYQPMHDGNNGLYPSQGQQLQW
jgi:hypothetical protein